MDTTPRTLSSDNIAKSLGVSAASVARYARAGRIPFSQTPGGHRRFDLIEVQTALSTESRVHLTPLPARSGRVNIAPDKTAMGRSAADIRRSEIRTVFTGETPEAVEQPAETLEDLFRSSPRVLVGTTAR